MTGHVSINPNSDNTKVVIFENSNKKDESGKIKNDKAPDFRIYLSENSQNSSKGQGTTKEETSSVPSSEEEVLF